MPKIVQLRTFDGALWARLEIDIDPKIDGACHVLTDKEIRELKAKERHDVWDEIQSSIERYDE